MDSKEDDMKIELPNGSVAVVIRFEEGAEDDESQAMLFNIFQNYSGDISTDVKQRYLHFLVRGLQYMTTMDSDAVVSYGQEYVENMQEFIKEDDADNYDLFSTLPAGNA